jgi:hypothetical protein
MSQISKPSARLGLQQLESREVPSVTSFVTHLYQDVLGRPPDSVGFNNWVNEVSSGTNTTGDVAIAFLTSDEYRTNTIVGYYQAQLGRTPSAAEVRTMSNRLIAGETQDSLRVTFFASEEFFNSAGRNPAQFVNKLYSQILGRSASDAEVNYWLSVLNQSNGDRTVVAQSFLFGAEYQRSEAIDAYVNLLQRPADSSGLAYWENQRANGLTVEAMDAGFLASPEYFNRI